MPTKVINAVIHRLQNVPRTQRGASAVEYALLVSGIAAVAVAAMFLFGDQVLGVFDRSCDGINRVVNGTDC
ncbi:Flp family type IVb pilin [Nocardioides campestrisoli]|uniref:Flp family type IVb pilin n=1 Tax=Nocardioides campestrisoli TaxID=2736757 RepID=UPI001C62C55B|nr:hypothetical protein [Nocardioides campestrisoli]